MTDVDDREVGPDPVGEEDLGEPVEELRGLAEEVSPGFLSRILSRLQRRSLVGHLATLTWTASAQAFMELMGILLSIFDPGTSPKKEGGKDG